MHCEAEQEECRGVLVSDKAAEETSRGGQHRVVRRLVSLWASFRGIIEASERSWL